MRLLAGKLTYANVMATLALFVALGGGAYAVKLKKNSVGPKQLKQSAVTERKIADSAVTGPKIRDGSVGLAEVDASLHQICTAGTIYLQGACIETAERGTASPPTFESARAECGPNGRLPSVAELDALSRRPDISWTGFAWTSARYTDSAQILVTTVSDSGALGVNSINGNARFRCVLEPTG